MIDDAFAFGLALVRGWQLTYSEKRLALTAVMIAPVVLAVCLVFRWVRR